MAYEDVLRDGQIGEEARLLVDDGNAERARVCGPVERHGLAVEHDGARIGLVDAREHLDDCALTGPVFADERMDLARQKRERDVQQRLRGPEPLRHPGEATGGGTLAAPALSIASMVVLSVMTAYPARSSRLTVGSFARASSRALKPHEQ